jgi:acyl-CoA thioesterase I
MKMKKLIISICFLSIGVLIANSQDYHVRIAFIGNSITAGTGLANPLHDAYPYQFASMLEEIYGDTCIVNDYAVSGRTMLKKGDYPIWDEDSFTYCLQAAPDILFILLGTNDSKPYNWDVYGDEFFTDYMSMIDTFKVRNPRTKFIISRPPPAFAVVYDIRESVIAGEIIPLVDSIASETGAYEVDFHTPLLDSVALFPDMIHPNPQGAHAMAQIVLDKFLETDIIHQVETGFTQVTRLKSSNKHIIENDSALLTWRSINADAVYLNGEAVDANGSKKVASATPASYTIKATGVKSDDSLTLAQDFYHPVIGKLFLTPNKVKIEIGETLDMKLAYADQYNRTMNNESTEVTWSLTNGLGTLADEDFVSASYTANSVGNDTIVTQIRDKTDATPVEIISPDKVTSPAVIRPNIYPVPADNVLNIAGMDFDYLELVDVNGRVIISTSARVKSLNLAHIESGIYHLKLYRNKSYYSEKIIIEHR